MFLQWFIFLQSYQVNTNSTFFIFDGHSRQTYQFRTVDRRNKIPLLSPSSFHWTSRQYTRRTRSSFKISFLGTLKNGPPTRETTALYTLLTQSSRFLLKGCKWGGQKTKFGERSWENIYDQKSGSQENPKTPTEGADGTGGGCMRCGRNQVHTRRPVRRRSTSSDYL